MAKKATEVAVPPAGGVGVGANRTGRANREAAVLAFSDFVGPDGATWHITIREGATRLMVDDLFKMCVYAVVSAQGAGFMAVSEINEFGKKMTIGALLAGQQRRKAEEDRRKERQAANNAGKAGGRPAAAKQPVAKGKAVPQGGFPAGWDTKKSPIAVSRLLVQGTADKAAVQMFSPNPKLKFPVFTVASSVVSAVIQSWYNIDVDDLGHLSTVGTAMNVQWLVHWKPSPKNGSWKDITDIDISKMSMLRREEALRDGLPELEGEVGGEYDEIPF